MSKPIRCKQCNKLIGVNRSFGMSPHRAHCPSGGHREPIREEQIHGFWKWKWQEVWIRYPETGTFSHFKEVMKDGKWEFAGSIE